MRLKKLLKIILSRFRKREDYVEAIIVYTYYKSDLNIHMIVENKEIGFSHEGQNKYRMILFRFSNDITGNNFYDPILDPTPPLCPNVYMRKIRITRFSPQMVGILKTVTFSNNLGKIALEARHLLNIVGGSSEKLYSVKIRKEFIKKVVEGYYGGSFYVDYERE